MRAVYPENYGFGNRIKMYLPGTILTDNTPHVYTDGEICTTHDDWTADTDILDAMPFLLQWLLMYESWLATGVGWD